MPDLPFRLEAHRLHWQAPGGSELSADGAVVVEFGGERLAGLADGEDWTLSAAALLLLRTLDQDHQIAGDGAGALIPHCGSVMWKLKGMSDVYLPNCNRGIDWMVEHTGTLVRLTSPSGIVTQLEYGEWRKAIIRFSDTVEHFYTANGPRPLPEDEFDRKGFLLFQNEWRRRRRLADRTHRGHRDGNWPWWTRLGRLIGR